MGTWISEAFTNMGAMFYSASSGLTFLGVLAVAGLAVAICLLLINIIRNFLRFG